MVSIWNATRAWNGLKEIYSDPSISHSEITIHLVLSEIYFLNVDDMLQRYIQEKILENINLETSSNKHNLLEST